jgi:hypothetical protein
MSEQQAPSSEDKPAVAGPNEAPGAVQDASGQDAHWFEHQYKQIQPEYTRSQQELKELKERQQWYELLVTSDDPDTRRQAAEVLGYELPQEEEPEPAEYEDPYESLAQRQERLEQQYEQMNQQQQNVAQTAFLREYVDQQAETHGLNEYDADTQKWILERAMNTPISQPPGSFVPALPDIQGAIEAFRTWETGRQKSWASTKRAPYVPSGGLPANEVPDRSTHESRVALGMRLLNEAEQ